MANDPNNTHFQLALDYVQHTERHIFLTGRAGTGKTTFLRQVREISYKKLAVLAPTGVAAVNAGGVTIHSFLQLQPGIYLPEAIHGWGNTFNNIQTSESLLRNLRLSPQKKELLQELELLIIDEVSMVRADTLDAIDLILRHVRNKNRLAFGGVQLLLIGDLFQLPPVAKQEDWDLLKKYYESTFFFDAKVMKECPPVYLELQKIYRQSDDHFIRILNAVRNNQAAAKDISDLNKYYHPGFQAPKGESYITLTTHNAKADMINQQALADLSGEKVEFLADIQGDFPEKSFPAEERLSLKTGAQVMFLKNDKGESRRYYNGRLATISRIEEGKRIYVQFDDESEELEIEPETWRNIRYRFEKEKDRIEEEELGVFKQFPIRLAWAITIHKSQGLSFAKAIVDAGESFSPGQVYVALSRMTDLSGMVLKSRIHPRCILTDERVVAFSNRHSDFAALKEDLSLLQETYVKNSIINSFELNVLLKVFSVYGKMNQTMFASENAESPDFVTKMIDQIGHQMSYAEKFSRQLAVLLDTDKSHGYANLHQRTHSAVQYFNKQISDWKKETEAEIGSYASRKRGRNYLAMLKDFEKSLTRQKHYLSKCEELTRGIIEGTSLPQMLAIAESRHISVPENPVHAEINHKVTSKKINESASISLSMFNSGLTVTEIAKERGFTSGTIYSHLTRFISSGELDIFNLLPEEKCRVIMEALSIDPFPGLRQIFENLGSEFSYDEIRAVAAHLKRVGEDEMEKEG